MKDNKKRVWIGCSNFEERLAELKANHESEELKALINRGFKVKSARVRRPRIRREKQPRMVVTIVFGKEVRVTIEEYRTHYESCGFKIIKKIY